MSTLRDRAQNVVEYGLIIANIAIVVLGVAKFGSVIGRDGSRHLAGLITTVGT